MGDYYFLVNYYKFWHLLTFPHFSSCRYKIYVLSFLYKTEMNISAKGN